MVSLLVFTPSRPHLLRGRLSDPIPFHTLICYSSTSNSVPGGNFSCFAAIVDFRSRTMSRYATTAVDLLGWVLPQVQHEPTKRPSSVSYWECFRLRC